MVELNEDTFTLYAASHYDNIQCTSIKEFNEDLLRFKYLNKLFFRYVNKNGTTAGSVSLSAAASCISSSSGGRFQRK